MLKQPPSLADFRKMKPALRDIGQENTEKIQTPLNRVALWITEYVGSMGFFYLILIWSALWLTWNFLAPKELQFDPPMGFVFWLFISNLLQILLMPLIMVGQNIQASYAEIRAENDLAINIKAEHEIEIVLQNLEYQNRILIAMLEKMGVSPETIFQKKQNL